MQRTRSTTYRSPAARSQTASAGRVRARAERSRRRGRAASGAGLAPRSRSAASRSCYPQPRCSRASSRNAWSRYARSRTLRECCRRSKTTNGAGSLRCGPRLRSRTNGCSLIRATHSAISPPDGTTRSSTRSRRMPVYELRQGDEPYGLLDMQLRRVKATRYVTPLREGGSLPALVEADDDGLYVLKFRGAGQGRRALVAEVVAGELARALGFLVPELVLADLDPMLGRAEPDPEIQDLLVASAGLNLGVDFLPSALPFNPASRHDPDADLAADIVWLDALVTNVDRTAKNPNLLWWHGRLWLIDHGAALYFPHAASPDPAHARTPFSQIDQHVLLTYASSLEAAHARLAARVTEVLLEDVVAAVPDEWLEGGDRRRYVDYLLMRVAHVL